MREAERIAEQLRCAHEGPAWHGPSLREILDNVTAAQAAAKPPGGAHSIWELVGHILAWERAALRGLDTGRVELSGGENFPAPAEISEEAWQSLLEGLEAGYLALRDAILHLGDADLEREVTSPIDGTYTVYHLLHGAIQHTLYHAGQIQIIKRAI